MLDDTEYLLNTSNINIAQSVHMSMEMKENQAQNNVGKVPAVQSVGAGLGAPKGLSNVKASISISLKHNQEAHNNWLAQANIINEQQEYENSRSREDNETQGGINSSVGKSE